MCGRICHVNIVLTSEALLVQMGQLSTKKSMYASRPLLKQMYILQLDFVSSL